MPGWWVPLIRHGVFTGHPKTILTPPPSSPHLAPTPTPSSPPPHPDPHPNRYKESKIGLRWRTQAEVVAGKGQFTCGAKGCDGTAGLCAYEVNFAYQEAGQQKQALVKLCLCQDCACKLDYRRDKDKQYRRLGSSTAFDRQLEQQRREDHEQQREAAGDRRRRDRDRDGRHGRYDKGQRQQQWDGREPGEADGVAEQSHRQRDRSPDRSHRQSASEGYGHGGSSRRAVGVEARRGYDDGEIRDRGRRRGDSDRGQREAAFQAAGSQQQTIGARRRGAAVVPERRGLGEGELNDADIERWLDSLFTAVPASGTA